MEQRRIAAQVLSDPELLLMYALSRQDVRFLSLPVLLLLFLTLIPLNLTFPPGSPLLSLIPAPPLPFHPPRHLHLTHPETPTTTTPS